MRALLRASTIALLVLSLGLHWAVLQSIAWTGMLIAYSCDSSFKDAVTKTFDGKHPCPMCKVIAQGRAQEKKRDQGAQPGFKLDPALVWQATAFDFARPQDPIVAALMAAPSRIDPPPTPPPRGSLPSHPMRG
jgi:hypothetical protein